MKDAAAEAPVKKEEAAAPQETVQPALQVLRSAVALIEKAVAQKETRTLFGRLLRQTAAVRRRLTAGDLLAFLAEALPPASPAAAQLAEAVKQVGLGPLSMGMWVALVIRCAGPRRCGAAGSLRQLPSVGSTPCACAARAAWLLQLVPYVAALGLQVEVVGASAMDADGDAAAPAADAAPVASCCSQLPEVEVYAYLLTSMFLLDHKQYTQVW